MTRQQTARKNPDNFTCPPRVFSSSTRPVRLDGHRLQPSDTVDVIGVDGGRITLVVVPARVDVFHCEVAIYEPDAALLLTPDGIRVLITHPTPQQLPREVIDRRFR